MRRLHARTECTRACASTTELPPCGKMYGRERVIGFGSINRTYVRDRNEALTRFASVSVDCTLCARRGQNWREILEIEWARRWWDRGDDFIRCNVPSSSHSTLIDAMIDRFFVLQCRDNGRCKLHACTGCTLRLFVKDLARLLGYHKWWKFPSHLYPSHCYRVRYVRGFVALEYGSNIDRYGVDIRQRAYASHDRSHIHSEN